MTLFAIDKEKLEQDRNILVGLGEKDRSYVLGNIINALVPLPQEKCICEGHESCTKCDPIEEQQCTKCNGAREVEDPNDKGCGCKYRCPHCNGTGKEPRKGEITPSKIMGAILDNLEIAELNDKLQIAVDALKDIARTVCSACIKKTNALCTHKIDRTALEKLKGEEKCNYEKEHTKFKEWQNKENFESQQKPSVSEKLAKKDSDALEENTKQLKELREEVSQQKPQECTISPSTCDLESNEKFVAQWFKDNPWAKNSPAYKPTERTVMERCSECPAIVDQVIECDTCGFEQKMYPVSRFISMLQVLEEVLKDTSDPDRLDTMKYKIGKLKEML